jgi:hypothetical protein
MFPDPFRDVLILTGPTGSGKTNLGLKLAERLGAEIVSIDSMALYRGMDIGTAKPTAAERRRIPYHLIDVFAPWESVSVASPSVPQSQLRQTAIDLVPPPARMSNGPQGIDFRPLGINNQLEEKPLSPVSPS